MNPYRDQLLRACTSARKNYQKYRNMRNWIHEINKWDLLHSFHSLGLGPMLVQFIDAINREDKVAAGKLFHNLKRERLNRLYGEK